MLSVKLIVPPTHTGVLLNELNTMGNKPAGCLVTAVVAVAEQALLPVTVTEYVPTFAAVMFVIKGALEVLEKELGPAQA